MSSDEKPKGVGLVLSTQKDEEVIIILEDGREIIVTTVDIRGDKVRTGYNAPKTIGVFRRRIYDAMKRENREEAQVSAEVSDKN